LSLGGPPSPREQVVVEEGDAERPGEQVEEPVVAGRGDRDLQEEEAGRRDHAETTRAEDEEGEHELDREHDRAGDALRGVRQVVCVPARPRREGLRPVVVLEGGQVPPDRIAARELDPAREEHEAEEEQAQQEEDHRRRRPGAGRSEEAGRRGPQDREEAGLEEQRVPLELEEGRADRHEREIEAPEEDESRQRQDARDEGRSGDHPRRAHGAQDGVARAEPPEDGRDLEERLPAELALRPLEEAGDRREPARAEQPLDLPAERPEREQVDQPDGAEEQTAGGEVRGHGRVSLEIPTHHTKTAPCTSDPPPTSAPTSPL
jgi:hypothetical protein